MQTTNQGLKVLRVCIDESKDFVNSVVAQTLFPGSNTYLTCYKDGVLQKKVFVTTQSSNFILMPMVILMTSIVFLFL